MRRKQPVDRSTAQVEDGQAALVILDPCGFGPGRASHSPDHRLGQGISNRKSITRRRPTELDRRRTLGRVNNEGSIDPRHRGNAFMNDARRSGGQVPDLDPAFRSQDELHFPSSCVRDLDLDAPGDRVDDLGTIRRPIEISDVADPADVPIADFPQPRPGSGNDLDYPRAGEESDSIARGGPPHNVIHVRISRCVHQQAVIRSIHVRNAQFAAPPLGNPAPIAGDARSDVGQGDGAEAAGDRVQG